MASQKLSPGIRTRQLKSGVRYLVKSRGLAYLGDGGPREERSFNTLQEAEACLAQCREVLASRGFVDGKWQHRPAPQYHPASVSFNPCDVSRAHDALIDAMDYLHDGCATAAHNCDTARAYKLGICYDATLKCANLLAEILNNDTPSTTKTAQQTAHGVGSSAKVAK